MSREIRVVIANSARVMREMLLDAIRKQPNIAVVAEVSREASIPAICESERADWAVVPLERGRAPILLCTEILRKRRRVKVLAIAAAADLTALCWWSDGEVRCAYMKSSRENIVKALGSSLSGSAWKEGISALDNSAAGERPWEIQGSREGYSQ
jgi:DNA-binding NarL/FixJ family response regulator